MTPSLGIRGRPTQQHCTPSCLGWQHIRGPPGRRGTGITLHPAESHSRGVLGNPTPQQEPEVLTSRTGSHSQPHGPVWPGPQSQPPGTTPAVAPSLLWATFHELEPAEGTVGASGSRPEQGLAASTRCFWMSGATCEGLATLLEKGGGGPPGGLGAALRCRTEWKRDQGRTAH